MGRPSSRKELQRLLERYPIPTDRGGSPRLYTYGTAGFRCHASLLPPVAVRMGVVAVLRSISQKGQAVGLMITASHNPAQDNGLKMADPNGGMLAEEWEALAQNLVNAPSTDDFLRRVQKRLSSILDTTRGNGAANVRAKLHLGRDTRKHSPLLVSLVQRAAQSLDCQVVNHGVLTTPQLHYCVLQSNPQFLPNVVMHAPRVSGYNTVLATSYRALLATASPTTSDADGGGVVVHVDCACGVGYSALKELLPQLAEAADANASDMEAAAGGSQFRLYNGPEDGPLNHECGADFVQKAQKPPRVYGGGGGGGRGRGRGARSYHVSLDGDADRIVFFVPGASFRLLDGDKIASLVALFLQHELESLYRGLEPPERIRWGVVQTAYANGASTRFLLSQGGHEVLIAKTGVKYVHRLAHENFDVGIYFEANGHGTVLFGPAFYSLLHTAECRLVFGQAQRVHGKDHQMPDSSLRERAIVALRRLRVLPSLINQAVGDAISDLLLVDAILQIKGWTVDTWYRLYEDLPSRQLKVAVQDRSSILTNENETRVVEPQALQNALDAAVSALKQTLPASTTTNRQARCFVRPSGTEDVVRVYAEAPTQRYADALASEAAAIVQRLCGGEGGGGTKKTTTTKELRPPPIAVEAVL